MAEMWKHYVSFFAKIFTYEMYISNGIFFFFFQYKEDWKKTTTMEQERTT